MSDKHAKFPECIPVSQRKISLNIDDLPDLQPYSRVSSKAYERYDRTEDIFRGGRLSSHKPDRERSWIADKSSSANNLPDDLNVSWEYQPLNRDGKGKMSLQIESHHQSSSSAVGYASGGKVSPPPQQVPLLGLGATGKRPAGIGTENVKQEIVMAERGENSVVLRVTLLAAGFVVGPNGASIHQIEAVSGAKVYSFNRSEDREVERPTRQFHIEGPPTVVQHAVDIICHAIQLYKDLAEGNHSGMTVKRLHKLDKVVFRYEPPQGPRSPSRRRWSTMRPSSASSRPPRGAAPFTPSGRFATSSRGGTRPSCSRPCPLPPGSPGTGPGGGGEGPRLSWESRSSTTTTLSSETFSMNSTLS